MNQSIIEKIQSFGDTFYLLKVSIGPVQEFISEARKTRDLFIGSHLLSQITLESMKPIKNRYGSELIIYPYMGDLNSDLNSIPNMYLAVIPDNEINDIVEQISGSISDFWNGVGETVANEILDSYHEEYNFWMEQLKKHFYLNWVAVPITIEELTNSYKSKIKDAQHFLEERKMTRNFDAWQGRYTSKCVQCGHRESMPDKVFSRLLKQKKYQMKIKENERLCAICLLKRVIKPGNISTKLPEPKFESVIDVSAGYFKQAIIRKKKQTEIQNFFGAINKLKSLLKEKEVDDVRKISGEWYYKDNLSDDYLTREYGVEKNQGLEKLSKNAQESLDAVYSMIGKEPTKYYAIVNMDGDDMGKVMSGELHENSTFTIDYHNKLSKTLAETGAKTSELIEDGYCVYSGGDDLLAFLPLEISLPVINRARFTFSDKFKIIGETLTSSAGIVILHHHDPLRTGLAEARNNIEKAKQWFRKKDAFVITLRIYSGTAITWASKWTIENFTFQKENDVKDVGRIYVLDILNMFISFMAKEPENRLSPIFVRDLLKELPVFYEQKIINNHVKWFFSDKMFKAEFSRLLKRHIPVGSYLWTQQYKANVNLLDLMSELFAYMANPENEQMLNQSGYSTKDNFEHFLQISLFLVKETKVSYN